MKDKIINTNGERKNKLKSIIAREFIYLVLISIVCLSILKIGEYFQNRHLSEVDKNIEILDNLPQHQLLWYKLRKHNLYNKNYESYKKDFKNTEDQIVLFNLVQNNDLYTNNFSDFRVKYFRKEGVLDDCYSLYFNEYRLDDEYIQNQDKEFWNDLRKKEEEFKNFLKNDSLCYKVYSVFVKNGYKHSFEEFKNLIFEPYKEGLNTNEIDNLEESINRDAPYFSRVSKDICIYLFILFFPFRYLFLGLKWSLREVKNKKI
jgi:hypothetical protein